MPSTPPPPTGTNLPTVDEEPPSTPHRVRSTSNSTVATPTTPSHQSSTTASPLRLTSSASLRSPFASPSKPSARTRPRAAPGSGTTPGTTMGPRMLDPSTGMDKRNRMRSSSRGSTDVVLLDDHDDDDDAGFTPITPTSMSMSTAISTASLKAGSSPSNRSTARMGGGGSPQTGSPILPSSEVNVFLHRSPTKSQARTLPSSSLGPGPLRLDTSARSLSRSPNPNADIASPTLSSYGYAASSPPAGSVYAASGGGRGLSPAPGIGPEHGSVLGLGIGRPGSTSMGRLASGTGNVNNNGNGLGISMSSPSNSTPISAIPKPITRARTLLRTVSSSATSAISASTAKLGSAPGGRRRVKPLHFVIVGVVFWVMFRMNAGVIGEDEYVLDLIGGESGTGSLQGGALANRQALSRSSGGHGLQRTKHSIDDAYEDPTALAEFQAREELESHHAEAELRRGKAIRGEKHGRGDIEKELAERAGENKSKSRSGRGDRDSGNSDDDEGSDSGTKSKLTKYSNQIPYAEDAVGGLSSLRGYAKNLIVGSARGAVGHEAELSGAGLSEDMDDDDSFGPSGARGGSSSGSKWTTPFASTGYGILQSLPGFKSAKSAISALNPLTGGRQYSINDDDTAFDNEEESESEPTIYRPQPEIFMQHFPGPDPDRADYREWNHVAMRDLYACLAVGNCGVNQGKVALLAAQWIQMAVVQGHAQGEGVWGRSMYNALKGLGYTVILATTWEEALYRYRQMPELTKIVVRNEAGHCHYDPNCVKSESNPTGIPAWKIFDFEFFPGQSTSMLKDQWLLSPDLDDHPEMNRDIQYIGYSIEEDCETRAVTPLEERDERAWLFAKELRYLHDENEFAWDLEWFPKVAEELGMGIVGALRPDPENRWELKVDGVKNLGTIGAEQFQHELGTSRALLGVGAPYLSPSPFVALCQGVPFINPIMSWDENDPENRLKWNTQQPTLRWYDPPFVYNVKRGDYEGFKEALSQAMKHSIPRTILPHMKEAALRERMMNLMETDWESRAEELLEKRKTEGGDTWTM